MARVYVFNGRFAPVRAVLRACQSREVTCYVHERGHDIHHYAVDKNTGQHDLAYMQQQIRQQWNEQRAIRGETKLLKSFILSVPRG